MDGFVDGVDVTGGDGEGEAGDSSVLALNASGISSSSGEKFELVFDFVFDGEVFEVLDHFGVTNEGGVEDFDRGAFTEFGNAILSRNAGEIVGEGDIEGDAEVGLETASGGGCPTKSNFFLGCGDSIDVNIVGFGGFDGFDHDEDGTSVIHGFTGVKIAHGLEISVHCHHVADSDLCFGFVFGQSGIHEVIFKFGAGIGFGGAEHVLGFGAEHEEAVAGARFGVNDDALGGHHARVEAAKGMDAQESVVINVLDNKADFVHVGGEHQFFAASGSLFDADQVAKGIGCDFVADIFELAVNDPSDEVFLSGDSGGFG